MPLYLDLSPGDTLEIEPNSPARVEVVGKTGRRVRLAVESDTRVRVIRRARTELPAKTRCEHGQYAL